MDNSELNRHNNSSYRGVKTFEPFILWKTAKYYYDEGLNLNYIWILNYLENYNHSGDYYKGASHPIIIPKAF